MAGTWTRPKGTKYGVEAVRCSDHSEFSEGAAINRPTDPDGDRCYTPWTVGRPCETCGKPS
jgi:hypothetical protein